MAINLLWWEHEQLLDHLRSREDIWAETGPGRWLRNHSYDDDTACMGLVIGTPKSTGIFRQHVVNYISLAWTNEQCEEYLTHLVRKWTDYGTRMQYVHFLVNEAGVPADKAQGVAVGLLGIENAFVVSDPDAGILPSNRKLWPDIVGPDLEVIPEGQCIRLFPIQGGGWVRVKQEGGMLKIECSLRTSSAYGGGFGGNFNGYIRPRDGNIPLASAYLFGNPLPRAEGMAKGPDHGSPVQSVLGAEDDGVAAEEQAVQSTGKEPEVPGTAPPKEEAQPYVFKEDGTKDVFGGGER